MKIRLFCAAGMSTSLLVKKMEESAIKRGLECSIIAYPVNDMQKHINDCDIALLGPQAGYRLKNAKVIFDPVNVPVDVIPMRSYGLMDGEAVLEFALSLKK